MPYFSLCWLQALCWLWVPHYHKKQLEFDQTTSRGPFQPQPFCDSVKRWEIFHRSMAVTYIQANQHGCVSTGAFCNPLHPAVTIIRINVCRSSHQSAVLSHLSHERMFKAKSYIFFFSEYLWLGCREIEAEPDKEFLRPRGTWLSDMAPSMNLQKGSFVFHYHSNQ